MRARPARLGARTPVLGCWLVGLTLLGMPGCDRSDAAPPAGSGDRGSPSVPAPDPDACVRRPDGIACVGEWALQCEDEAIAEHTACTGDAATCVPRLGCRACAPGRITCDGEQRLRCNEEGTGREPLDRCDASAGLHCSRESGECADLCAYAEEARSYIGCEYWAVPTSNAQLESAFAFAVVLANPQAVPAEVHITRGDEAVATLQLAPDEVVSQNLAVVPELKGSVDGPAHSTLVADAAYHISSDVPVTAFQFNPLEFETRTEDGSVYSHTNDASLLLPTPTLTGHYLGMSRPALLHELSADDEQTTQFGPGFLAILGAGAEPTEVEITASAYTAPTEDGSVPALAPGERTVVRLAQGQVLQLVTAQPETCPPDSPTDGEGDAMLRYCDVDASHDLTGTELRADGPIAVFGGHDCAFVPHHRWACDHLEQMLFPLEAWGDEVIVAITEPIRDEPNVIRILSGADDNRITLTPALIEPLTLNRGEYIEIESHEHVQVSGSSALSVGQFLVGQDYAGLHASTFDGVGDPAFSLAIPRAQWRRSYDLLAPQVFFTSYVNVIAAEGQPVWIDGRPLGDFVGIEGTGLAVARKRIGSGAHHLESSAPFGVTTYGFASYTSYMVPGGLDLRLINAPD